MMFTGFTFRDKHSFRDFGITISDRKIRNPSKIERKERIPYTNIIYDFSQLYEGGQEFGTRTVEYWINIAREQMIRNFHNDYFAMETAIVNWLLGGGGQRVLRDDLIPGFHFLAEVVDRIDTDFLWTHGRMKVTFTAYPFKIGDSYEGNDDWDTFNFLLDYAQVVDFEVSGELNASIYSVSLYRVRPVIVASNPLMIHMNGRQFSVPAGESEDPSFFFNHGENVMSIFGIGTVEFRFRKEML